MASITSLPSGVSGSSLVLLSTTTASSSATVDITSNIDSTYKEYIIKFINIHPATDGANLGVQFNASGGSGFNETLTTTIFRAYHQEDGGAASLDYVTGDDIAQGTGYMRLGQAGGDNDQHVSGTLHLFDPSSTTFVKHFIARTVEAHGANIAADVPVAGYINTTSAIDEVSFKFHSGDIDSGTFKLYGVS
tara:strand:+ start:229 stop:801 length:573 start_codon:yes stop_codon:yes gene_type:complete